MTREERAQLHSFVAEWHTAKQCQCPTGTEGGVVSSRIDTYLMVQNLLKTEEQKALLERFTKMNPRLHGANVTDILSMLDDSDANLDIVEPLMESVPDNLKHIPSDVLRTCIYAIYWSHGSVDWQMVYELVNRE